MHVLSRSRSPSPSLRLKKIKDYHYEANPRGCNRIHWEKEGFMKGEFQPRSMGQKVARASDRKSSKWKGPEAERCV